MAIEPAEHWRSQLLGWAIPDEIIASAPESPWGFPPKLFAQRATSALRRGLSPANLRALEALPHGGTVLDVGVGGGAATLPIAGKAGLLIGVDASVGMLAKLEEAAAKAGIPVETVAGTWPEVAPQVRPADVVVCHHVLYNVPDLVPFVTALSEKARNRVVVELTPEHPLAWMSDLWMRFHGLERPTGPTYADAARAIRDLGYDLSVEVASGPPVMSGFSSREDAIALVRKRLCLRPEQDPELAEALGDRLRKDDGLWSASSPQHEIATLWWSPDSGG